MIEQPSRQDILYVAGLPEDTPLLSGTDPEYRSQLYRYAAAKRLFSEYCDMKPADCTYCRDQEESMCTRADKLLGARPDEEVMVALPQTRETPAFVCVDSLTAKTYI